MKRVTMCEAIDTRLRAALDRRIAWLRTIALPFWARVGVDPCGGFYERIDQQGRPQADLPRRARVVARQTYVFATATERGWGDYSALVEHGADALFKQCLMKDGLALSTYAPSGTPLNCAFDAYDQAFVLFALAAVSRMNYGRRSDALAAGERLLKAMQARFRHPEIGFEESVPRRLPLLQNPHMHLLEACLAFDSAPDASPIWRAQAEELVRLATTRLTDRRSGAVHEYFDGNWRPVIDAGGGIIEPGHQFEWAWLLWQWHDRVGDRDAAVTASRLFKLATSHGLAQSKHVIDALSAKLAPRTLSLRLWPQTEWLKACLAAAQKALGVEAQMAIEGAAEALTCLDPYLATRIPGLWNDRLDAAGRPIEDAAPASSLYHIVCAVEYAERALDSLSRTTEETMTGPLGPARCVT